MAFPNAIRNSTRLEKEGTFLEMMSIGSMARTYGLIMLRAIQAPFLPLVTLSIGEREKGEDLFLH